MSQKRTSVLDWQIELCLSDHPRMPHFSAPPYRPLHFSTPSTSPCHHESWSLSRYCLVAQVSSFLEWPGHYTWSLLNQIELFWNSSRMPLAVLAMASSAWATGLLIPGPLNSGTNQFSGKSTTPLPSHAFSRGISGRERSSSSTATTKQQWIFGLLALTRASLLCILFVPYSLALLPTTTQFSSLILLALITLLLIPCLVSRYLGSVTSPQQQTCTQLRFPHQQWLWHTA